MTEIKFLKDLPIKLTNTNKSVLVVLGGDIYYDSDGNRYGFISFKNPNKSPIFAMQLAIREYSVDGKFIRDNELFESYTYYPSGEFVINEPILLDKEAEAIEVTIVKLTFRKSNFVNDRFVAFKVEDYVELYQSKVPVKKSNKASDLYFSGMTQQAPVMPSVAPLQEQEDRGEETPQQEEAAPIVNEEKEIIPTFDMPNKEEEAPVVEEPIKEAKVFGKEKKLIIPSLALAIGFVVLIVIVIIIMASVTGGVTAYHNGTL